MTPVDPVQDLSSCSDPQYTLCKTFHPVVTPVDPVQDLSSCSDPQ